MQTIFIRDVHAYEARNSYWSGEILKGISGASLYQTNHIDLPWGFSINCDDQGRPHTVQFANGIMWSFCVPRVYQITIEWPLFVKDFLSGEGNNTARIERIYSDSMHLSLMSDNSCLRNMLIWYHPPRQLSDEYAMKKPTERDVSVNRLQIIS
jgi:hypothetical protein